MQFKKIKENTPKILDKGHKKNYLMETEDFLKMLFMTWWK